MAVALCLLARPQEKGILTALSSQADPPHELLPYVVGMPKPLALTPWFLGAPPPTTPTSPPAHSGSHQCPARPQVAVQ